MNREYLIHDLVKWIENHLNADISIDTVSEISGYSKWHLQRIFSDVTGHKLGSYVRARKLTRAAVALRLTRSPIIDIANHFAFETQQSFTRSFKRQFHLSPAEYRRRSGWFTGDMCPPVDLNISFLPVPHYRWMKERVLTGLHHSYPCSTEQPAAEYAFRRKTFWNSFTMKFGEGHIRLYGLYKSEPHPVNREKKKVSYFTAYERSSDTYPAEWREDYVLPEGNYVMFRYNGSAADYQSFIFTLYRTCLPSLKITRRNGCDIEIFSFPAGSETAGDDEVINCEYHIPIN